MSKPSQKEYNQMVAIGKRADKMAKKFLSTPPAKEESWEIEFDKQFSVGNGRKWILTQDEASEIKSFIRSLLTLERERIQLEYEKRNKIHKSKRAVG